MIKKKTLRQHLDDSDVGEAVRIAAACGCDTSTVYRIAAGDDPSAKLARKIVKFLKGTVDYNSLFTK